MAKPLALIRQRVAYILPFEIVSVHLLVCWCSSAPAYWPEAKRRRGGARVIGFSDALPRSRSAAVPCAASGAWP